MSKINTSPLSGTRDFLPIDVLRRRYVVGIVEDVYQSFGFEPLETPVMERLETLLGKYGEEGDQLIFRVMKRGEKLQRALQEDPRENHLSDAGLRYDLTVPLARVAAEYQAQLPKVFKRYQIQPVFRADRPAKGRFREFFQCDLDVVGSSSPVVEAEVLAAAAEVLRRLGFGAADFRIRLNHRSLLRALLEAAGVPENLAEAALVAVDKLDKIDEAGVLGELRERGVPEAAAIRLLRLLADAPSGNTRRLDWLADRVPDGEASRQAIQELRRLVELTGTGPAGDHVVVDPALARGLSYYTGPIFEVEVAGFGGSAGGGGRYDNLIGMFSGRQVPACGFSLGLERILLIMQERGMFPERLAGQPEILVTIYDEDTVAASLAAAQQLRRRGLRVDVFPDPGKYPRQFRHAEQRGIRFALLLGPQELDRGVVVLKDLHTGEQWEMPLEDVAGRLSSRREEVATSAPLAGDAGGGERA